MASANEPGQIRLYAEAPDGSLHICHKFHSKSAIAAGFSPDGVLANTTVDKQVKVGLGGPWMTGGWILHLFFKPEAADGYDASDNTIQIAVTEENGTQRQLSASDIGYTTDLPAGTLANQWVELGTGFTVPNAVKMRVGSRDYSLPTVIAIEDDTA
jgi:hypothetical protein